MNTKALNSLAALVCRAQEQDRTPMGIAFAIDAAGRHMSPEVAAELERLRELVRQMVDGLNGHDCPPPNESPMQAVTRFAVRLMEAERQVAELEAERHSTNEALDDAVQALRERGQREAIVAEFVAARAGYIVAIRNCHPDNGHDYDRWQGHAEARRQLAGLLGLPVAWPPEDDASVAKSADKLTALLAPTQALREDDEFHLHHDYRVPRDLPRRDDPARCLKVHPFSPRDGWRMVCDSCDHGRDADCHQPGGA